MATLQLSLMTKEQNQADCFCCHGSKIGDYFLRDMASFSPFNSPQWQITGVTIIRIQTGWQLKAQSIIARFNLKDSPCPNNQLSGYQESQHSLFNFIPYFYSWSNQRFLWFNWSFQEPGFLIPTLLLLSIQLRFQSVFLRHKSKLISSFPTKFWFFFNSLTSISRALNFKTHLVQPVS